MAVNSYWETENFLYNQFLDPVSVTELIIGIDKHSGSPKAESLRTIICDWAQAEFKRIAIEDIEKLAAHLGG